MKVHGRCHCGAIAYEADVDPARVSICHCTDCQRRSAMPWAMRLDDVPRRDGE